LIPAPRARHTADDMMPQADSVLHHPGTRARLGVVLPASFFGFFAHTGFLLALEEEGLEYDCISGTSAGALVAALSASGLSAREIAELLCAVRPRDFWDAPSRLSLLRTLLAAGRGWTGYLRGERLEALLRERLRARTFEACRARLYITALNLSAGREETFTRGDIARAVRASCSYPFLIAATEINGAHYWDGGFIAKTPLEEMLARARPERVLIHYVPMRDDLQPQDFLRRRGSALHLLERALAVLRVEVEEHRRRALDAYDGKIEWVMADNLPPVKVRTLEGGRAALEAAYENARRYFRARRSAGDMAVAQVAERGNHR
jgi:NTE family protein